MGLGFAIKLATSKLSSTSKMTLNDSGIWTEWGLFICLVFLSTMKEDVSLTRRKMEELESNLPLTLPLTFCLRQQV